MLYEIKQDELGTKLINKHKKWSHIM